MLKRGDQIDIDDAVLYAGGCPEDFHYHYAYNDSVKDGTFLYLSLANLTEKNFSITKLGLEFLRVSEKSLSYVLIFFFKKVLEICRALFKSSQQRCSVKRGVLKKHSYLRPY